MTIKQILRKTAGQFRKNKVKNPALPPEADREAEILLSHILKKNREFLFTYPEKELTREQVKNYKKLTARRLKGEPVAYLTGQKEFYGLDFFVNKNILIPRPETELMVGEAINRITHGRQHLPPASAGWAQAGAAGNKKAYIIDIGTGSGCIIITLAKTAKELSSEASELSSFIGIDISKPALVVAKKNAKLHKLYERIKFLQGDLLKPIMKNLKSLDIRNCNLVILANLPYLTPSQVKSSPTIKYEPKTALDGGRDGLKYYKKLFRQVKQLIKLNSAPRSLLCEIDPRQTNLIKRLTKKYLPRAKLQIKKDLAGRNRLMIIENTV